MTQPEFKPNFLVSIPITDEEIVSRAVGMQQRIRQKLWLGVPARDCAFTKSGSLHIPLLTAHINRPTEERMAEKAVEEVFEEIDSRYGLSSDPLRLGIYGLGHSEGKILFAKVSEFRRGPQGLAEMSSLLRQRLEGLGIRCDPNEYKPQMTLANAHKWGLRRYLYSMLRMVFGPISSEDWEGLQRSHYGAVRINGTDSFRVGYI